MSRYTNLGGVVVLAALLLFAAGAWAGRSQTTPRTVYRPSPQCRTAATTAAEVIRNDARFGGLIDAITAAPVSGAGRPAIRVGTNLPAFDHRTPDLGACADGK